MLHKTKWTSMTFVLGLLLAACSEAKETDAPYDDEVVEGEASVDTDYSGLHTTPTIDCVPPPPAAPSATVMLVTSVINDNGGTATPASFETILRHTVGGYMVIDRSAIGTASPGYVFTLAPNSYTVNANPKSGYAFTIGGDCAASGAITLKDGDKKTCVIIANDIAPPPPPPALATLRVVTTVINNDGGVASITNFSVHVRAASVDVVGSPAAGTVSPGTGYSLVAGSYVVSPAAKAGYAPVVGGDCDAYGAVVLAVGATKTCLVTYDDIAAPPPGDAAMTIRCAATSSALTVTITGPVQSGIFTPVASPKSIQYGGNAPVNYWTLPYPAGTTGRAELAWTTNAGPYVFTLPADTNGINFYVASNAGGVGQWFNLNSGSPWTVLGDCVMSNTLIMRK